MKPSPELQEMLAERRRILETKAVRLEQDKERTAGALSEDFEEQAVERENDEVIDALEDSVRRDLQALEVIENKIQHGTYGICETCGKAIDAERIKALPLTLNCRQCAS